MPRGGLVAVDGVVVDGGSVAASDGFTRCYERGAALHGDVDEETPEGDELLVAALSGVVCDGSACRTADDACCLLARLGIDGGTLLL